MSLPLKLSSPATRQFWEIPVLFEDDHLLAIDKPAGLAVETDDDDAAAPSLLGLIHSAIAEAKSWTVERRLDHVRNPHRPETGTTGVLLLSKTKAAFTAMATSFGSEKPVLRCSVLAQGAPSRSSWEIEAKLAPRPDDPRRLRVDSRQGKRSRTRVQVAEVFRGYARLECLPLTHRPYQLSAHLQYIGLPVAGDKAYGGRPLLLSRLKPNYRLKPNRTERPLIDRPALHIDRVWIAHPASGAELVIEAPLPKDFVVALKYLRQYAGEPQGEPTITA